MSVYPLPHVYGGGRCWIIIYHGTIACGLTLMYMGGGGRCWIIIYHGTIACGLALILLLDFA